MRGNSSTRTKETDMRELNIATSPSRFAAPRWTQDSPEFQALDRQLPADHRVRWLHTFVDQLDLLELEALYRGSGSEAYPPGLLLKIALYETLEGHLSPAAWHRHLKEHIPLQWLGLGIQPSRTALYNFRDRLGHVIDALLADVIGTARRDGLVEGEQGVLDGTTVRAQASRHRLLNQPRLQKRLDALNAAVDKDQAGQTVTERPGWMATSVPGRCQQRQRYLEAQAVLQKRLAENAKKPKHRRLAADKVMVSVSDPEAPTGRDKEKVFGPLYTTQFLIEPCSLLIIAFDVFAQATDAGTLPPMLDKAAEMLERALKTIITDAGYVSVLDLKACAERHVELIAPEHENDYTKAKAKTRVPDQTQTATEPPIGKDQFTWDPQEQTYRCPQGHVLKHVRRSEKRRRQEESIVNHEYQCPAEHCLACPLKSRCVKDPSKGRLVSRIEGEELLEEHRRKMATPQAQKLRKLRGQVIERGFGDAKQHRNLRKLHGRGLLRAKAEIGLVVLAQDALMLQRLRQKAVTPVEIAA
jgi:transposase